MLELHNVRMKPSNVKKEVRKSPKVKEKKNVTCDVRIAQCENGTIKCEKKK